MKRQVKKTKKKQSNKTSGIIVSLIFIVVSLALLYPVGKELSNIIDLRAKLKESKLILAEIEKENVYLTEQKTKLNDPEYIKSYARGEYLLSKEGEQIFKLPSKK